MWSESPITSEEERAVEETLSEYGYGEKVQFLNQAFEGKNSKKAKEKRILVVTSYQILVFQRGKNVAKQPKEIHLYDLAEVGYERSDKIEAFILKVRDPKSKGTLITTCIAPHQPAEFLLKLRNAFQRVTPHFPPELAFKINQLPDSWYLPVEKTEDFGKASGYIEVYKAHCCYFRTLPSVEFISYVSRSIHKGSVDLDLTLCPGIEAKSEMSLQLTPILASLRFNTYFRSLIIDAVPNRKESLSLLADVMRTNSHLTRLKLTKVGGEERAFLDLGQALKENKKHSLQVIDLSGNNIGNKGAIALGEALQVWPNALKYLNLSNCHIHAKGIVALICALDASYGMSLTLEELNLSGNNFDKAGTMALEVWFTNVKSYCKLKNLCLSNSNVNLSLLPSLKLLPLIAELDISGNRLDTGEGWRVLSFFCEFNHNLRKLDISNTQLTKENLEPILEAIVGNIKLRQVELNVSNNALGNSGQAYITKVLSSSSNISALDMSGMKMKDKTFIEFLKAASNNANLEKLVLRKVLDKNSTTSKEKTIPVAAALISLLESNRKIKTLDLSDGYGRGIIQPVLRALETNTSLTSLNISSNQIGDKGAESIGQLLRYNSALTSLEIDENKITYSGFLAIQYALETNKTLVGMKFPRQDVDKSLAALADYPEKCSQLIYTLSTIINVLRNNVTETPTVSQITPTTVEPLAEVPEFLKNVKSTLSYENVPDMANEIKKSLERSSSQMDLEKPRSQSISEPQSNPSLIPFPHPNPSISASPTISAAPSTANIPKLSESEISTDNSSVNSTETVTSKDPNQGQRATIDTLTTVTN